MKRFLHCNDEVPKSLASSVDGTKSLSNLPVAVIVSEVALPRSTLPSRDVSPETVTLLLAVTVVNAPDEAELAPIVAPSIVPALISAVSATKASMLAVPSR